MRVSLISKDQIKGQVNSGDMETEFKKSFKDQFFIINQEMFFQFKGVPLRCRVESTTHMDSGIPIGKSSLGQINDQTEIEFSSNDGKINLIQSSTKARSIFKPDFKFEDMGIGGLGKEIADIFRRAFSSRRLPPAIQKLYGVQHVRGLILYGPPGTGKTLIARQLAKCLNSNEPKIVNGPELFNKFVGETEKNVRELFADAKRDQNKLKDESPLHIVIFDEFDAIAKHRGSSSGDTGVKDNVVNQLLSMIDGVEALNNILVIGMTNRLDLIDKAVLRPGRFEVHVEVGLPNKEGRIEILNIHTVSMRKNNLLDPDVSLEELAEHMKNYTGAEIEAVVKSANSFALNRHHNLLDFKTEIKFDTPGTVAKVDFDKALMEVRPEFGVEQSKLDIFLQEPLVNYGQRHEKIIKDISKLSEQVKSGKIKLASIALIGKRGTGKSSIAAQMARNSGFPFVKFVSSEDMVGTSLPFKIQYVVKAFEDAYKSTQSIVILDDLERLVEYVEIGRRFNNDLLQALLVLISKLPEKKDSSILIIATCSNQDFFKELGFEGLFNVKQNVPELSFNFQGENEVGKVFKQKLGFDVKGVLGTGKMFKIPIKNLLFGLSLIKADQIKNETNLEDQFQEAMNVIGHHDDLEENTMYNF